MNNKVLVKIIAPEFDKVFDVYIPVNYLTWKINKMLAKCIGDLCDYDIDLRKEFLLINKQTNEIYKNNTTIRNTNIRNGTELIFISKN